MNEQTERTERISAHRLVKEAMLKILRSANGKVVFILSGCIEAEDVVELEQLFALEMNDHQLVLDLKDVTLVDPDAVKFLARWEANGVRLENCPAYLRKWIVREGSRDTGPEREYSN
jgi:hypothetical protein